METANEFQPVSETILCLLMLPGLIAASEPAADAPRGLGTRIPVVAQPSEA